VTPDLSDLARLDEEMAPLRSRLDELGREYNRVVDAINEQTLAALDLSEVRARTGGALRRLPAVLVALEEVLAVHDELSDWAYDTLGESDEQFGRLRAASGVEDGDADRAREALAEIVGRAG
jgi:hypothetical protein